MTHKYQKTGIIAAIIIVVSVILILITNSIIEKKLTAAINKLPKSVKIDYSNINSNILSRSIEIGYPHVRVLGETTTKNILDVELSIIKITNIDYWDFLFNDKISLGNLVLNNLIVKYKHNSVVKKEKYKSGFLDNIKQFINVENISINNVDILVTNYATDSILLSVPKLNFEINDIKINPKFSKVNKKINYSDFHFTAENLKWEINEFDDLSADLVSITDKDASLKNVKLKTKYNKDEFSTILKKERDHFNLDINEIKLSELDFGFNDIEQFYFITKSIYLNSPEAEIYRDKLVTDDLTYKPLYGSMLRELDFELGLKTIKIDNGKISYLEKVKVEEKAGQLNFTNMNATISNLGNIFADDETSIKVNSTFMENSSLEVDWNFKVADTTDQFIFKADLGLLKAVHMNQFTKPNLNVDLNGELYQTYFTVSGNPETSRIDLKIKYDDFEVAILRSNGKEQNKFLSSIVNLFIAKDSEENSKNFSYGQVDEVNRDVNKSVFNFIWLNIKGGLLSAIAGDGKQED